LFNIRRSVELARRRPISRRLVLQTRRFAHRSAAIGAPSRRHSAADLVLLEQAAEKGGIGKIYSPQAVQLLVTADWPGNVRQLFDLLKQSGSDAPRPHSSNP
jgi:hypothetical protein